MAKGGNAGAPASWLGTEELLESPMLRLLICGDREWDDPFAIVQALYPLDPTNTLLVTGGARGADTLADKAAAAMSFGARVVVPANWEKYHKAAGPIRNKEMLGIILGGPPEHDRQVWAFHDDLPNSRGTANMVKLAQRAKVRVRLFRHRR